jgi:hypothetical protein
MMNLGRVLMWRRLLKDFLNAALLFNMNWFKNSMMKKIKNKIK